MNEIEFDLLYSDLARRNAVHVTIVLLTELHLAAVFPSQVDLSGVFLKQETEKKLNALLELPEASPILNGDMMFSWYTQNMRL